MGPRIESRRCPLFKVDCKHNKAPDGRGWACGVPNEKCPGVRKNLKAREVHEYNRRRR